MDKGGIVLLGFLGGLVFGMFSMWGWYTLRARPETSGQSSVTTMPYGAEDTPSEWSGALVIRDQSGGFAVAVSHIEVLEPTWAVIYEDAGGQPGNALGAGLFTPDRTSGTVHLLRGMLPGNTYYGVLHRDDGDRIFSLERDFPLRDNAGDPIMVAFMTQ